MKIKLKTKTIKLGAVALCLSTALSMPSFLSASSASQNFTVKADVSGDVHVTGFDTALDFGDIASNVNIADQTASSNTYKIYTNEPTGTLTLRTDPDLKMGSDNNYQALIRHKDDTSTADNNTMKLYLKCGLCGKAGQTTLTPGDDSTMQADIATPTDAADGRSITFDGTNSTFTNYVGPTCSAAFSCTASLRGYGTTTKTNQIKPGDYETTMSINASFV